MKSTSRLFRFEDRLFDPPVTGQPATANMRVMAGSVFLSGGMTNSVFAKQGMGRFTKIVGLVALALASFGRTGIAAARSANAEHGIVETRGLVTKVVAVGPIALHAYSQFAGGSLYTAPAVTGTDPDCQGSASATSLGADRITAFAVGGGQVACLKTTTKGSFELLWHAVSQPVPAVDVAKAGR
jgi:hypothetical protein